ncbi:T9SS type A sorting domain-containing protein [Pseudoflavitalea rhizosphaerae]|uniref:T9SS type A sorting domain-containing protein n=1 Tax=Pseudoflavitalea rhizosphaerae TaxID=1884793 RepID=UPI0013DE95AD|nr:T9SS type A sorting domain-containing protein [Pseudoflavitalea rhizosphaerae]
MKAENSSVHLIIHSGIKEDAWIRITDISGRIIAAEKVKLEKGTNRVRIPASIINGNVYIATMNMNGQTQTVKFLKK